MTGLDLPSLVTAVPGPRSRARIDALARHECPAITARRARRAESLGVADDDPIVWESAVGANVRDVDGNVYVDLTSGFGVALVGHRDPEVVAAASRQAARLVHAMGDAWPDDTRITLLERLAAACATDPGGGPLSVAILGLSGSDAIDAAIKTAALATGRTGVLAFSGAYHGLALGVLGLQGYKAEFTEPFRAITHPGVVHLPYGGPIAAVRDALGSGRIGLVLVEPILGRGGISVPPDGWLADVAAAARSAGALFALDEIQTGIGRTGAPFAGPAAGVVPDLLCVGKALGGGYPLSACVGTPAVMAAWGGSRGEAIH
ncbi:MAG: aminotransferase class III-fold pyridoxal phosphate-dependent enzyme, partial [Myxococcota bacterium]